MTEEHIISQMNEFFLHNRMLPASLVKMEKELTDLFLVEFGLLWYHKEMKTAIPVITAVARQGPVKTLQKLFKEDLPQMQFDEYWIGTRSVSKEQFREYARALYFLAAMKVVQGKHKEFIN